MRKITRILGAFSFVLALCAALCIAASASLTDFTTAYGDITPENGYVHIGVHNNSAGTAAATDSDGDGKVEQYLTKGFNAYFKESTGTLVLISVQGVYTGDYGDWIQSSSKNTPGKTYFFAYWASTGGMGNAAKIKHLELRGGVYLNNINYAIGQLSSVQDVKIDSTILEMCGQKGDTGTFVGMKSLVTVGHGSFSKTDGKFTPITYKEGVADLSGFKKLAPNVALTFPSGIMFHAYIVQGTAIKKLILPTGLASKTGATYQKTARIGSKNYYVLDPANSANFSSSAFQSDGVWYSENTSDAKYAQKVTAAEDSYGGEYSGIIPHSVASNCVDLTAVVFGAPVLHTIESSAFAKCKNLVLLDIKGEVSPEITIASNAFSGVSALTVRLATITDAERFSAALVAAGIKNVSLSISDGNSSSALENPLTAEGFAIRTSGYNGLRGLFSFSDSVMAKNEAKGFSLVEYGVVAASGAVYDKYGSAEAVYGRVADQHVIQIPIYCVDGTGVNRYVDVKTKTFCVTITHFAKDNFQADIYMMSYAILEKDGVKYRMFREYEYESSGVKKCTISLFDTTLGLYNQGLVSPSICPEFDTVVAPILRYGGVTVALPTRREEYML